ncbi:MAG TPA: F0F1 ATP synthase subunit delta [Candidatus Saccharimonadales bacterium]|nr:F0F1 ATP synthase subunit delta [Candidatus Saccharimonadales bacterium]
MSTKLSRRSIATAIAAKLVHEPQERKKWISMLAAYLVDQRLTSDHYVTLIVRDIVREVFVQSGELLVEATTARPLTDALRHELVSTLRAHTGAKTVVLQEDVDPTLLGGFIARTPDAELDTSVRTTLKHLAAIK